MQKTSIWLWSGIAGVAALVCMGGMSEVRAAAASRSMMGAESRSTTSARMPTMPTMSINTVGTHAVSGVSVPATPTPTPAPTPDPEPEPEPEPEPVSDCPDGGVQNSEFTVDDCMQSMLSCVQTNLAGGLATLFNPDMFSSVVNGMGLCASQVDKCIREVRLDCHPVYDSGTDVWLDFNSRIVQPEYYNFVLRKTGLTPHQAENVCGLLDKNTYGKSFAAVSALENVTGEYQDTVYAYNNQSEVAKNQPQGPTENTTANGNVNGVDGERGHYARWDATGGVCKIRVAAYNGNDLITNSWLYGIAGDDKPAEVWQDAGSTFTCNKDLFDFSLLNTTSTVAATGAGVTLLGTGITALASRGAKSLDCGDDDSREAFYNALKKSEQYALLNQYVTIPAAFTEFKLDKCNEVVNLFTTAQDLRTLIYACSTTVRTCAVRRKDTSEIVFDFKDCSKKDDFVVNNGTGKVKFKDDYGNWTNEYELQKGDVNKLISCRESCGNSNDEDEKPEHKCAFYTLKNTVNNEKSNLEKNKGMTCSGGYGCNTVQSATNEANEVLNDILGDADIRAALEGQKSTKGKNALIAAGIGVGATGVATAITAFVERNRISCRVGDGLDTVGFGKSYTIGSLKDFYVKWNLRLDDAIRPTARVTSCQDWIDTCGMYTTTAECNAVEINYQRPNRNTTTLVRNACRMSGSVCIENRAVAVSRGACSRIVRPINPVNPITPIGPISPNGPDVPVAPVDVIEH